MRTVLLLGAVVSTALVIAPVSARGRYRDGMNLYQYVRSAPVARRDPTGLWPAEDHRRLTQESQNDAFPPDRMRFNLRGDVTSDALGGPGCRGWIQDTLQRANLSQDQGTPFEELERHYNRAGADLPLSANRQYTEYLTGEQMTFDAELQTVGPPCDTDAERQACRAASEALGRLMHSWQDYYAHAVLQSGAAGPAWSNEPPITGSPDDLNPQLKPSSWNGITDRGEHGPSLADAIRGRFEPADRDLNGNRSGRQGRYDAARNFVAGELGQYLPRWYEKCRCCCPP